VEFSERSPFRQDESPTPADLEHAADLCATALGAVASRSWDVPAGRLEWDVRTTVEHIADALGFYALHLVARDIDRLRFDLKCHADSSNDAAISVVAAAAANLAAVAGAAPPEARGWHPDGIGDRSGFVAMGCSELLVHTDDALRGLGSRLDPPDDLCEAVVDRLFPATPDASRGWHRLLWATGRIGLPDHGRRGSDWRMHPAPQTH
jgi:hypothetical protein